MRSCLLIADDDPEQLSEISEYLDRAGFDVVTANDGFHALEQLTKHRPRVIMLDVNMPGWDGVRVANAIRNLDHRAIIILMTADAGAFQYARDTECGAVNVFTKPVELSKLMSFLRPACGQSEAKPDEAA